MFRIFVFGAVLHTVLVLPAAAQTAIDLGGITVDSAAAVEVAADTLSVDQDTGKAVFTGNVLIGQGDLKMSADSVEVVYTQATGSIARLLASGGVTFVTATEAAEAENADYNIEAGTLTLTGDVLLTQGPSAISAQKMTVNLDDGSAVMEGRVRTVLQQGGN
ncbi:lipopolysaccharide transport periplasmic protein LptA [Yoonia sp. SS1-5]|uniref:Lipopolysaccharide transport periplasmic protein LptA n=1 Tax=Yoonia rhodophyticola TaxID=3137370 RepID=A0AAN0MBD8_9RHOB